MKQVYRFKDVFLFTKDKSIPVMDGEGEKVGTILRAFDETGFRNHTKLRKGMFYAFQDEEGNQL